MCKDPRKCSGLRTRRAEQLQLASHLTATVCVLWLKRLFRWPTRSNGAARKRNTPTVA